MAAKKKPYRQGTVWSTEEYAASGYDPTLSVRLKKGYKKRLQDKAKKAGTTVTALIESWIDDPKV